MQGRNDFLQRIRRKCLPLSLQTELMHRKFSTARDVEVYVSLKLSQISGNLLSSKYTIGSGASNKTTRIFKLSFQICCAQCGYKFELFHARRVERLCFVWKKFRCKCRLYPIDRAIKEQIPMNFSTIFNDFISKFFA